MSTTRRIAIALDLELPFPHHTQVFAGTQRYANENGWECVIDDFPGYRLRQRSQAFRDYDGVIARVQPEMARRLQRKRIPLVNTWGSSPAVGRVPSVLPDFEMVAQLAAEHLTARGFRRVCYFNTAGSKEAKVIQQTIKAVLSETGGSACGFEHPSVNSMDAELWLAQEHAISRALDQLEPPVGIFCGSSSSMRYVVNLCQARGWHVPGEAAVLCMMETPGLIDYPRPAISYIDMNWEQVGYEAAALLDRLMAGQPPPRRPILVQPKGVVARESTDYFAIEDDLVVEAMRYISRHLSERLSLKQIARAVAVSPRSLQSRFDAALGRPISVEIRRLRLEKAKRMLADKAWQISEVARQSGFLTATQMGQVFHRELRMAPSAYRKQVLGERDR